MHLLWLMLAFLAKSITARKLTCNTATTSNGTFYKVSDFGKFHCGAQWIDIDNHTLADSDGKNDSLVVASNLTTLHTYNCYNKVMYVLDCYPWTRLNKKVACVANCSESAGKTEGTRNHSWVIPVICIIVVILLVIGLVRIYYWRNQRRNQSGL